MDNQTRTELIDLLCNYPPLATREGRDAWLLNLPASVRNLITRRHEHCKIDLAFIIEALKNLQLQDGRWPILILIDSTLSEAKDLAIEQKLSRLRREIQISFEPPTGLDSQPAFQEIVIGEDEKVSVVFLENGLRAAKSVARIAVPRTTGGQVFGTGWLITPGLLLTNYHVIEAREAHEGTATPQEFEQQAKASVSWFGYDVGSHTDYRCAEIVHANDVLDYAVLRLTENSVDAIPLSDWGFLRITRIQPELAQGTRLNVIQHPGGRVKEIALRTNFYVDSAGLSGRFHYLSDTEGGSSGSPVLDDNWQVVGLHHAWDYYDRHYQERPIRFSSLGLQYTAPSKFSDQVVATINEGILIHTILNDLPTSVREEIENAQRWT
jgi:V8-like Glu-specific endopeptidase